MVNNTIPKVLKYNSYYFPNDIWIYCPEKNKTISWEDTYLISVKIAKYLYSLGLKKGDTVGIASHNSISSCLIFMGIALGGFVATPLNLVAGSKTIDYVINHSELSVIFVSSDNKQLISKILENKQNQIDLIEIDNENPLNNKIIDNKIEINFENINSKRPVLLMYTSGTTGNPKGVLLSHKNLIAAGKNVENAHSIKKSDIALCILPTYHINGLCVTVIGTLVSSSGLVIPYKFSTNKFWDLIKKYKCSWFSAVPTQFAYLLNDNKKIKDEIKTLRFARSASAPLSPEIHRKFENRFKIPIIETMGLTETGAQILSNPMPPRERKIGSPGIAFGNKISIVDENGKQLPANSSGEILVKGENVMIGYLKQPLETNKTITKDNWLKTGDIGYLDEDGYVFVTGRIKELIIKGGENIAPREIDEVLLEHETILEAAAFAVPCEQYGQRVQACIILKDKVNVSEEELINFCIKKIGKFKSPEKIYFCNQLPKGPSGKIQRLKLFEFVNKI